MLHCGNIFPSRSRAPWHAAGLPLTEPDERSHYDSSRSCPPPCMRRTCMNAFAKFPTTTPRFPTARSSFACWAHRAWGLLNQSARRAPHRPLGAHAVRGAGRHLGGAAQPLFAGRPAGQPQAPAPSWWKPCSTACVKWRSAARPRADPERDAMVGELLVAARGAVQRV